MGGQLEEGETRAETKALKGLMEDDDDGAGEGNRCQPCTVK